MSPHTALRLAARPLSQLATRKTLAQLPPPPCFRYNISHAGVGIGLYTRLPRHFSTARPPPKRPQPETDPVIELGSPSEPIPLGEPKPESQPSAESKDSEPSPTPSPSPPPEDADPSKSTQSCENPPSPSSSSESPNAETRPKSPLSTEPELPSVTDSHRHPLSAKFSAFMDQFQSRVLVATQTLNDLTGYSAIEAIKARNSQLESALDEAQSRLQAARQNYKSLTTHRASTQREVTTLLARKDTWNPTDLERFTSLYRMDHTLEAQVSAASAELTEAETNESKISAELNAGILRRYHEEQIWSDRIRRQSTWGTWGLMGVNFMLFLVLQFVAEPWRRKRMIKGIVETEKENMEEVRRELAEVKAVMAAVSEHHQKQQAQAQQPAFVEEPVLAAEETQAQDGTVPLTAEEEEATQPTAHDFRRSSFFGGSARPWKEVLHEYWEDPQLLKDDAMDLYSDRRIALRMKDVSIIALEGAAAGAAVVAAVALTIMRFNSS
ncbi:Mdm33 family-domain-containing protein [Triangularia verruculosa]|uniref:Sensitive to high expression protein 9, mitochondrial n=1 Tax=Triangularia verruculosa TaxID=2587418 RepID=A0AAN7AUT4_9PEZI|nr:Mdm33 family-domain-containing protein [Triangularia verruculosa]